MKMNCHPERSLPRFLRQTKSKDLRLFFNELQIHHTAEISEPSPAPLGTARKASILQLGKLLDQLFDEILKPLPNSIAEVGELKAYQGFRSNGSHRPAHVEGHLVDAEDQFHDLIHDEIERRLQCHQASVHAQVHDLAWARPLIGGQHLDAGMPKTLKTRAPSKFYIPLRFLLCLRLFGWHHFFTLFGSLRVLISLRIFIDPVVRVFG